jgi:hypothetical protein
LEASNFCSQTVLPDEVGPHTIMVNGLTKRDDSALLECIKDRVGSVIGLNDVTAGGLGTDSIADDA